MTLLQVPFNAERARFAETSVGRPFVFDERQYELDLTRKPAFELAAQLLRSNLLPVAGIAAKLLVHATREVLPESSPIIAK